MTAQPTTHPTELMDEVAALARERVSAGDIDLVLAFVADYYAGVSPDDLAERKPDDLYGAAVAHLNLARRRAPGTPKVRVYNPQVEQHGWQSTHTVVEIVTDDMPFLIDSVADGAEPARVHEPPRRPPGDAPAPRRRRPRRSVPCARRRGGRVRGPKRSSTSRPTARPSRRRSTRWARRCSPPSTTCGPRWRTGPRCARSFAAASRTCGPRRRRSTRRSSRRPAPSSSGSRTTTSRSSGSQPTGWSAPGGRESASGDRYVAEPGTGLGLLRDEGGRAREAFSNLPLPRRRRDPQEPELLVLSRADRPLHRAPPEPPRLHRHPSVRRRGQRPRGAPVPRPLHLRRLQPRAARHPPAAAQGRRGARPRRLPAQQPTPPRRCRTSSTPSRASCSSRSRPASCSTPRWGSSTCRSGRRIRLFVHPDRFGAVLLLHRVRAEGPVHHREPACDPGDPGGDARRHRHRVHGASHRVGPGPALLRRPRRREAPGELRHRGPGRPPAGGEPHLGRRPARRPAGVLRRGARHAALPALRRRVPRRLPRELLRPGGGARRGEDGADRRGRHRDEPLPPAGGGGGDGCASSSSRPDAVPWCSPTRSRCWRTWASRWRTSTRARSSVRAPRGCGSTISECSTRRAPTSIRTASTRSSATRSPASGRARSRTTASTGWCCAPGSDGARS